MPADLVQEIEKLRVSYRELIAKQKSLQPGEEKSLVASQTKLAKDKIQSIMQENILPDKYRDEVCKELKIPAHHRSFARFDEGINKLNALPNLTERCQVTPGHELGSRGNSVTGYFKGQIDGNPGVVLFRGDFGGTELKQVLDFYERMAVDNPKALELFPKLHGVVERDGQKYLVMEDLTVTCAKIGGNATAVERKFLDDYGDTLTPKGREKVEKNGLNINRVEFEHDYVFTDRENGRIRLGINFRASDFVSNMEQRYFKTSVNTPELPGYNQTQLQKAQDMVHYADAIITEARTGNVLVYEFGDKADAKNHASSFDSKTYATEVTTSGRNQVLIVTRRDGAVIDPATSGLNYSPKGANNSYCTDIEGRTAGISYGVSNAAISKVRSERPYHNTIDLQKTAAASQTTVEKLSALLAEPSAIQQQTQQQQQQVRPEPSQEYRNFQARAQQSRAAGATQQQLEQQHQQALQKPFSTPASQELVLPIGPGQRHQEFATEYTGTLRSHGVVSTIRETPLPDGTVNYDVVVKGRQVDGYIAMLDDRRPQGPCDLDRVIADNADNHSLEKMSNHSFSALQNQPDVRAAVSDYLKANNMGGYLEFVGNGIDAFAIRDTTTGKVARFTNLPAGSAIERQVHPDVLLTDSVQDFTHKNGHNHVLRVEIMDDAPSLHSLMELEINALPPGQQHKENEIRLKYVQLFEDFKVRMAKDGFVSADNGYGTERRLDNVGMKANGELKITDPGCDVIPIEQPKIQNGKLTWDASRLYSDDANLTMLAMGLEKKDFKLVRLDGMLIIEPATERGAQLVEQHIESLPPRQDLDSVLQEMHEQRVSKSTPVKNLSDYTFDPLRSDLALRSNVENHLRENGMTGRLELAGHGTKAFAIRDIDSGKVARFVSTNDEMFIERQTHSEVLPAESCTEFLTKPQGDGRQYALRVEVMENAPSLRELADAEIKANPENSKAILNKYIEKFNGYVVKLANQGLISTDLVGLGGAVRLENVGMTANGELKVIDPGSNIREINKPKVENGKLYWNSSEMYGGDRTAIMMAKGLGDDDYDIVRDGQKNFIEPITDKARVVLGAYTEEIDKANKTTKLRPLEYKGLPDHVIANREDAKRIKAEATQAQEQAKLTALESKYYNDATKGRTIPITTDQLGIGSLTQQVDVNGYSPVYTARNGGQFVMFNGGKQGFIHVMGPGGFTANESGFKARISVDPSRVDETLKIVLDNAADNGIKKIKIVNETNLNSFSDPNHPQSGKFITVYDCGEPGFDKFLSEVQHDLQRYGIKPGPTVQGGEKRLNAYITGRCDLGWNGYESANGKYNPHNYPEPEWLKSGFVETTPNYDALESEMGIVDQPEQEQQQDPLHRSTQQGKSFDEVIQDFDNSRKLADENNSKNLHEDTFHPIRDNQELRSNLKSYLQSQGLSGPFEFTGNGTNAIVIKDLESGKIARFVNSRFELPGQRQNHPDVLPSDSNSVFVYQKSEFGLEDSIKVEILKDAPSLQTLMDAEIAANPNDREKITARYHQEFDDFRLKLAKSGDTSNDLGIGTERRLDNVGKVAATGEIKITDPSANVVKLETPVLENGKLLWKNALSAEVRISLQARGLSENDFKITNTPNGRIVEHLTPKGAEIIGQRMAELNQSQQQESQQQQRQPMPVDAARITQEAQRIAAGGKPNPEPTTPTPPVQPIVTPPTPTAPANTVTAPTANNPILTGQTLLGPYRPQTAPQSPFAAMGTNGSFAAKTNFSYSSGFNLPEAPQMPKQPGVGFSVTANTGMMFHSIVTQATTPDLQGAHFAMNAGAGILGTTGLIADLSGNRALANFSGVGGGIFGMGSSVYGLKQSLEQGDMLGAGINTSGVISNAMFTRSAQLGITAARAATSAEAIATASRLAGLSESAALASRAATLAESAALSARAATLANAAAKWAWPTAVVGLGVSIYAYNVGKDAVEGITKYNDAMRVQNNSAYYFGTATDLPTNPTMLQCAALSSLDKDLDIRKDFETGNINALIQKVQPLADPAQYEQFKAARDKAQESVNSILGTSSKIRKIIPSFFDPATEEKDINTVLFNEQKMATNLAAQGAMKELNEPVNGLIARMQRYKDLETKGLKYDADNKIDKQFGYQMQLGKVQNVYDIQNRVNDINKTNNTYAMGTMLSDLNLRDTPEFESKLAAAREEVTKAKTQVETKEYMKDKPPIRGRRARNELSYDLVKYTPEEKAKHIAAFDTAQAKLDSIQQEFATKYPIKAEKRKYFEQEIAKDFDSNKKELASRIAKHEALKTQAEATGYLGTPARTNLKAPFIAYTDAQKAQYKSEFENNTKRIGELQNAIGTVNNYYVSKLAEQELRGEAALVASMPDGGKAYFEKNKQFMADAKLTGRQDITTVSLATSPQDVKQKMYAFAPDLVRDELIARAQKNNSLLPEMDAANQALRQHLGANAPKDSEMLLRDFDKKEIKGADNKVITVAQARADIAAQKKELETLKQHASQYNIPGLKDQVIAKEARIAEMQVMTSISEAHELSNRANSKQLEQPTRNNFVEQKPVESKPVEEKSQSFNGKIAETLAKTSDAALAAASKIGGDLNKTGVQDPNKVKPEAQTLHTAHKFQQQQAAKTQIT